MRFVPDATSSKPSFLGLVLITGTGALATDMYIAALPQMERDLGISTALAQLTMTACIAGMAIGQLIVGPISDSRGRRTLILIFTAIFALMSALCAVAEDGSLLIAARLVQGFASGAAAAIGRAVVTDVWEDREAAAKFGSLTAVGLIAPVLGPSIGGLLLGVGTWRTIFWFLFGVGVCMLVVSLLAMPETLPPGRRHPGGLRQLVDRSNELLHDRAFVSPVLIQCLATAGFFVYIGGSSFVLQDSLGVSPSLYTLVFATNGAAMMAGSLLNRALIMRFGPVALRNAAIVVQTSAVGLLFLATMVASDRQPSLAVVWLCLAVMTFALGVFFPTSSALSQLAGQRYGGTASALGGGLPYLIGALTTPVTGLLGSQSVGTMATVMFGFFVLSAAAAVLTRRDTVQTDWAAASS